MSDEIRWHSEALRSVQGIPWRFVPYDDDTGISIHISEEAAFDEEEPEEPTKIIDDEGFEEMDVPKITKPKSRLFSVNGEDIARHDIIDRYKCCIAIVKSRDGSFVHSDGYRERIMTRILKDGDTDGRMPATTERSSILDVT